MSKVLRKGTAKDRSYIYLECQCKNGIDTFIRRFIIKEENEIFLGYGCYVRTPDFYITIKEVKYACFYADGKNITIPYDPNKDLEFDGICYSCK